MGIGELDFRTATATASVQRANGIEK
jgi:hypothetical protein